MTSDQKQESDITQRGRNLLTLIRDAGGKGINRKGITDAIHDQLSSEDEQQLHLLEANGLITIEQVDIDDHPDVDVLYQATSLNNE